MKRWFGLAAILALVIVLVIFNANVSRHRPQAQTTNFSSNASTASTASTTKPRLPSAQNSPVQLQPGLSGKAAVKLTHPAQNITEEIRRRDEALNRYLAPQNTATAEPYYRLNLRAIDKNEYRADLGPQAGAIANFIIYENSSAEGALTVDQSVPVVAGKSNGRLGLVTGTIVATLRDPSRAPDVAKNYGLTLKYEAESTRQAYFSAAQNIPLDQVLAALEKDPDIEAAYLEIVQGKKKF